MHNLIELRIINQLYIEKIDEIFAVSESDTMYFRDVVDNNFNAIGKLDIIDKAMINMFLECHKKNKKRIEGIMTKILNE